MPTGPENFAAMLEADAAACMDSSESVTVFPEAGTLNTFTTSAVVVRNAPSKFKGDARTLANEIMVFLPKSVQATRPVEDIFRIQLSGHTKPLRVVRLDNEHDPAFWQMAVN